MANPMDIASDEEEAALQNLANAVRWENHGGIDLYADHLSNLGWSYNSIQKRIAKLRKDTQGSA